MSIHIVILTLNNDCKTQFMMFRYSYMLLYIFIFALMKSTISVEQILFNYVEH